LKVVVLDTRIFRKRRHDSLYILRSELHSEIVVESSTITTNGSERVVRPTHPNRRTTRMIAEVVGEKTNYSFSSASSEGKGRISILGKHILQPSKTNTLILERTQKPWKDSPRFTGGRTIFRIRSISGAHRYHVDTICTELWHPSADVYGVPFSDRWPDG
jgi:hypothetical protein